MKRSIFIRIREWIANRSKTPWACYETTGVSDEGRIEFSISYNTAFVNNIQNAGFVGSSPEESVQLFFLASRMLPEEMIDANNSVNPTANPLLSNDANILKR